MRYFKSGWLAGTVGICVALLSVAACTQPAAQNQPAPTTTTYESEEYLLLGDATRGAGEPMIAVDPTNPKNMIAVAMGSIQQLHGKPATRGSTGDYHLVGNSTITWLAVTDDGGVTWDVKELPILSGKFKRCPDSFADVTKDGDFIAGCEPRETDSIPDFFGGSAFLVSTDKGKTWGPKVDIISDYGLDRFAEGLEPISGGFPTGSPDRVATHSPWDRPFTHIDDSTGVIYGVARGGSTAIDTEPGVRRSQAYITASTDGGKSFGTVYSWDSKDYPQASRGIGVTAAHGVVAVTYIARSAPASENVEGPCAVFGISRDQGKTFDYHILENITATPPEPGQRGAGTRGPRVGSGGLTDIAADPTTAGRIAMLKYENASYSVAVSEDDGETWSPFVIAGTTTEAVSFTKPSFEYSRDGILGLMWRAIYEDETYDIWSAISRDGGQTFSRSLKVSHARSPGYDLYRNAGLFGDDIQDLCMDSENIHMVWGDSRSGFQGVWYGRVAFSSFEFPAGQ